ncbi:MAG: biotin--[acetyl-CoA-carboxylase] ligase [Polyangiaceae bacterium]
MSDLAERLRARGVDAEVSWVGETESTSDDAKRVLAAGDRRVRVFVADHQTKGRGRNGNTWSADPGAGLLLSIALFPSLDPASAPGLTLAVGAALAERLDATLASLGRDARVQIKWPNDLEIGEKKLAGILVEAQTRGDRLASVVVGVGINVLPSVGNEEVARRSAALTTRERGRALDRAELAFDVVDAILSAVGRFERIGLGSALEELARRDALLGARVRVGDVEGIASGIDATGALVVRTPAGDVPVAAGSVLRLT